MRKIIAIMIVLIMSLSKVIAQEDVVFLYVEADRAEAILGEQTYTFTGNVYLTEGDDYIKSDKLSVMNVGDTKIILAEAVDSDAVEFNIHGHKGSGGFIQYNQKTKILKIKNNAILHSVGNVIKSEVIVYNVDKELLISGGDAGRVFMKIFQ